MATPISRTWLEMQIMGLGGVTCVEAQALLQANYPGATDATVIDSLTWMELNRSAGLHSLLFPSVIRAMSATQRRDLIVWMLQQIQSSLPVGWPKTAAVSAKLTDYINCLNASTAQKRAAIQAYASSIVIDYEDTDSRYIEGTMKGLGNLIANQVSDHADVTWLVRRLIAIAVQALGLGDLSTKNAVLTRMQKIIGVID